MAVYYCIECDRTLDDDYFPCVEHPIDPTIFCCERCAEDLEEKADMDKEFKSMKDEYEREIISGLQRRMK